MTDKSIVPFELSEATINMPTKSQESSLVRELEAIVAEPLDMIPPSQSFLEKRRGRSPAPKNNIAKVLSPKTKDMKNKGAAPRPTTGILSPRKGPTRIISKNLSFEEPFLEEGEEYLGTWITKDGTEYQHDYRTVGPSKAMQGPKQPFRINGVRVAHGRGKTLIPPLTASEKQEMQESSNSSPIKSIRRHLSPRPIRRPGGQYESSDDNSAQKPNVSKLTKQVAQLRLENKELAEQLAEEKLEIDEIKDNMKTLQRAMTAKLKRVCKAVGQEDLYKAP